VRFAEPGLGLQNQVFPDAHHWQVQFSYQYANAHDFFVGRQRNDAAGPFGVPPRRKVLTYDLNVLYSITNRFSVDLTVPYFSATGGSLQGTAQSHSYHEVHTAGVGDLALGTDFLLTGATKSRRGWASIGLGVKAPTGSDSATTLNYNFNPPVQRPVDESGQAGAGGWVMLLRAQGAAEITERLSAYGGGFYGVSLTEHTKVVQNNAFRAVPDTYSARAGVAWLLPSPQGFTVSAGGRMFGITTRDLMNGGNLYFRRPGYEVYFEPGVSWASRTHAVSVTVPIRVAQNKRDSLLDISRKTHVGSDFAPYLIIVSYTQRF
jgi:hypothetical protein